MIYSTYITKKYFVLSLILYMIDVYIVAIKYMKVIIKDCIIFRLMSKYFSPVREFRSHCRVHTCVFAEK